MTDALSMQAALLGAVALMYAIAGRRERILLLMVGFIPVVAFARRVVDSGDPIGAGQAEFDPLVVSPLLGAMLVIATRSLSYAPQERAVRIKMVQVTVALIAVMTSVSVLFAGPTASHIYFAASFLVPLLLMIGVATGRIPDVWPRIERVLPWLALLVGVYGLYQFFVLPSWDRDWMLGSGLRSIGSAEVRQMRVFGTLESPGPYAQFLGVGIIIAFHRAVRGRGGGRAVMVAVILALVVPFLLSGVRSTLVAVLLCTLLVAARKARVGTKGVAALSAVFLIWAVGRVTQGVGASSFVLSQNRYDVGGISSDDSFVARLAILNDIPSWFRMLGDARPAEVDNLFADVLKAYGAVAAVGIVAVSFILIASAWTALGQAQPSSAPVATLFALISGLAGNFFTYSFALLVALAFGSTLLRAASVGGRRDQEPGVGGDSSKSMSRIG